MKAPTIIYALVVLFFVTCQKEETSPKEELEKNEITTADIGRSGGLLQTEHLSVIIPAGAFLETEELNLVELTDTGVFGDNSRSIRYKIEGLPETYDKSIKICIAYQGALSEETFIMIGSEAINPESGEDEVLYDFLPAADSSGFLICYIPGIDDDLGTGSLKATAAESGKKWISVEVISDYFSNFYSWGDVKYKIYIPASKKEDYSPMIINYLDNAYTRINHSILEYLEAKYVNIFSVFMANLSGEEYCKFAWRNGSIDNKKRPKGILAVNVNKMDEEGDIMSIMVGREVLRSFLFCFDPEYPHLRQPEKITHHWLDQAVLSWSETEFAHELDRADHIPTDFKGNELKPFTGMHAGILQGGGTMIQNITDHGRGMAAFIQYLTNYYSNIVIPGLYLEIYEGYHPVDAIKDLLEDVNEDHAGYSYKREWFSFLCEYMLGEIYEVSGKTFVENISEANLFSINTTDDTLKIFQGTYPDLSAKLYRIDLNDPDFKEKGTLEFSITGGSINTSDVGICVFGYNNDKITHLGDGLIFAAETFQAYNSILVLVSNATANTPYTGNSTIELKVNARQSKTLPYNRCRLEISCKGIYEHDKIPPVNPEPFIDTLYWSNFWNTRGSTTGNVYTGIIDSVYHGENTSGTISVTFNDDLNITSYNLSAIYLYPGIDSVIWNIEGVYLEKSYESGYYLQHEVSKSGVCNTLSKVHFYSESPTSTPGTRRYSKIINHLCDENSHLKFGFRHD